MGKHILGRSVLVSVILTIYGCGDDGGSSLPPPRLIEGGGIGDGPIDGVANVYVIDDTTRAPIAGATVHVGTVEGTTDETGLFIAENVVGPQQVAVKADAMRSELWVGANGTNMTVAMQPMTDPVVPRASISGRVDTTGITVDNGHTVAAAIYYSQTDDLGDPENEIETPGGAFCVTGVGNDQPCNYTIDVRTGTVTLVAAIFDRDLNNTPLNPNDDTHVLLRWATTQNITVVAGVPQSDVDLALIATADQETVTVDFQSPPSGLATIAGIIGIELGPDHVLQIPLFRTPQEATLLVPKPSVFGGTTYRLTGIAANGTTPSATQSIVLRRALAGPTVAAGTWLEPPTDATATRTAASWTPAGDATLHGVEYKDDADTTKYLNVTIMDGSASITIPELVAVPPTGALVAAVNAIGAPGLDVTSFSLDADRDKLVQIGAQPVAIP